MERLKKCSKCGETKPLSEFYISREQYISQCKNCFCRNQKIRAINRNIGKKICVKCGILQNINEFKNIISHCNKCQSKKYHRRWSRHTISEHRRRGYIVNFSIDWLEEKTKSSSTCNLCGIALDWRDKKGMYNKSSPTLDRRNNENELNINNVDIICYSCNSSKQAYPRDAYIKKCKLILSRVIS
jgi:hypothetical protein